MARATRRVCRDCGFYVPLGGELGLMFGVCANEFASDGHVVDAEFGCGAHSDTPAPAGTGSPLHDPYDDGVLDVTDEGARAADHGLARVQGLRRDADGVDVAVALVHQIGGSGGGADEAQAF